MVLHHAMLAKAAGGVDTFFLHPSWWDSRILQAGGGSYPMVGRSRACLQNCVEFWARRHASPMPQTGPSSARMCKAVGRRCVSRSIRSGAIRKSARSRSTSIRPSRIGGKALTMPTRHSPLFPTTRRTCSTGSGRGRGSIGTTRMPARVKHRIVRQSAMALTTSPGSTARKTS